MANNTKKKRLHLARIPAYGTSVLTKCGRKRNINESGFTNPKAKLCDQCVALAEAEGMSVEMTWVLTGEGEGKWSVKASPPMLERRGNTIIDRNNPDAAPVYLDVNKVLSLSGLSLDDYYEAHGPGSELVPAK